MAYRRSYHCMISQYPLPRMLPNAKKVTTMARLTDSSVKAIKPPATGQSEYPDDLVTGLRLRVGAGGRKAWIVRTRVGGKPINRTIGSYPVMQLTVARDQAKHLLLDIQKHGAPRPIRTIQELVDHWIETEAKPKNSSWKLQQRAAELHVLPKWASRAIESISRGEVRDLIDGIEGKVAPNRVLALVRKLFRHGLSRDWISVSPAEAIAKPNAEKPRDRYLDMKEVVQVYRAAELLGYPYGGFIKILLLTGQRRTEVASMRWNDIDLEAATWMIGSADTKAGRAQFVPLSPAAVDLLKAAPKIGPFCLDDRWVFPTYRITQRPKTNSTPSLRYREVCLSTGGCMIFAEPLRRIWSAWALQKRLWGEYSITRRRASLPRSTPCIATRPRSGAHSIDGRTSLSARCQVRKPRQSPKAAKICGLSAATRLQRAHTRSFARPAVDPGSRRWFW